LKDKVKTSLFVTSKRLSKMASGALVGQLQITSGNKPHYNPTASGRIV